MERGSVTCGEVERLGRALMNIDKRLTALKASFDLNDDDLDVRVTLQDGRELGIVELVDAIVRNSLAVQGRLNLGLANVPLIDVAVGLTLTTCDEGSNPASNV